MLTQHGPKLIIRSVTRRFRRSAVVFTGIALAMAALVTLEAIMEGVTDAMIRNSVAIGHGHVHATWQAGPDPVAATRRVREALPDALAVLPRKQSAGTLVHDKRELPATLIGIDPALEDHRTAVSVRMTEGTFLIQPGELLLGRTAGETLDARVGQDIAFWRVNQNERSFRVGGIYDTGIDALDRRTCFANLEDVPGQRYALAIFLPTSADSDRAAAAVRAVLPTDAAVTTWQQALPELVQLIALNTVSMDIVQALALLILAFGVANAAYIAVNEQMREFAILKAMGVTPGGIMLLVEAQTLGLVTPAAAVGVALGAIVSMLWGQWGLDLSRWTSANVHFVLSGVIYPHLVLRSVLLPAAVAILCGLLAGALPAWRAGRISVIEALRQV